MTRKKKRKLAEIEGALAMMADRTLAVLNERADVLSAVCTQAAVEAVRAELEAK